MIPTDDLPALLLAVCKEKHLTLGTAESLTAGMIASTLANVSGASAVLRGGVVSYHSEVKHDLLGVDERYTAVDDVVNAPTAEQMVKGACAALKCDYAISATGFAGPTGGTETDPVGTVYIGFGTRDRVTVRRLNLTGDRQDVRLGAVREALTLALESLQKPAVPERIAEMPGKVRC